MAQTACSKLQKIKDTPVRVTLLDKKKELVKETPLEHPGKEVQPQPVAMAAQQFETGGLRSEPKTEETIHHNANPLDIQVSRKRIIYIELPAIILSYDQEFTITLTLNSIKEYLRISLVSVSTRNGLDYWTERKTSSK